MVEEITGFELPDPAIVETIRTNAAELRALGIEAMDE